MGRGKRLEKHTCTQTFDFQNASENSRANHVASGHHRIVVASLISS